MKLSYGTRLVLIKAMAPYLGNVSARPKTVDNLLTYTNNALFVWPGFETSTRESRAIRAKLAAESGAFKAMLNVLAVQHEDRRCMSAKDIVKMDNVKEDCTYILSFFLFVISGDMKEDEAGKLGAEIEEEIERASPFIFYEMERMMTKPTKNAAPHTSTLPSGVFFLMALGTFSPALAQKLIMNSAKRGIDGTIHLLKMLKIADKLISKNGDGRLEKTFGMKRLGILYGATVDDITGHLSSDTTLVDCAVSTQELREWASDCAIYLRDEIGPVWQRSAARTSIDALEKLRNGPVGPSDIHQANELVMEYMAMQKEMTWVKTELNKAKTRKAEVEKAMKAAYELHDLMEQQHENTNGEEGSDGSSDGWNKRRICGDCLVEESEAVKLSLCSACRRIRYCSPQCQKKDWKRHKMFCKIWQKEISRGEV